MINYFCLVFFLLFQNLYTKSSILVIPFRLSTYIPKIEGSPNVTDLINQYLVRDMFTTIEIGSGTKTQKVTTLISIDESLLTLSNDICKKKSLDSINDLSIVSKTSLDINTYNSDIKNKQYSNYLDSEKKVGILNDSILIYNTLFLSSQPIEYYSEMKKDTKMKINNVFMPIKDKNDKENNKLCAILGIGSSLNIPDKLKNLTQFIFFLKKNEIISDYSWTFKFHTRNEGRLIIGDLPHNYEQNTKFYHEDKIINTNTFSPDDKRLPWSFDFKEIYFYNSNNETINVGKWIKMILMPNIGFIIGEDKYKNLILENYFQELIDKNICILERTNLTKYTENEITFGTTGIYELFHCNKSLINEKKIFPKLNFYEGGLDYTFTFSFNNLFELIDERYYFLIIFPEDLKHPYYKVWYLGLPFYYSNQYVFNYDSNTISIYDQNKTINSTKKKNKKEDKKNFSGGLRITLEVIIGLLLVVIAYFIGKKINEQRKKRANELNDNYEYTSGEENNINGAEDNLIQNNNQNNNRLGF